MNLARTTSDPRTVPRLVPCFFKPCRIADDAFEAPLSTRPTPVSDPALVLRLPVRETRWKATDFLDFVSPVESALRGSFSKFLSVEPRHRWPPSAWFLLTPC
eukprot:CAMPEP_0206614358 /NCGR_PEP_ID=MMETSP0325_2-20121206/57337_1 /ASSEMBLY_ACC=CAM_ASM_000347 /TAXON_ID=2866 /ORGANISM="Crypthecodinium cohnii, Strain Seligo" /LENGTH=101 /DNA_ID=CAMNT_0054134825 /DNA_START=246 /DNA_END=551 /DNA_ORIENTATION=-